MPEKAGFPLAQLLPSKLNLSSPPTKRRGTMMVDWLLEGRLSIYLFLAILAAIFAAFYIRIRKRVWIFPIVALLVLIGVYFLLDRVVETRREQIVRKLNEMAAAVQRRDVDTIFSHISDRFSAEGMSKATFRQYVELAMRSGVDRLGVWDFHFPEETGRVTFQAKPDGSLPGLGAFYRVRAEFVLEGKEWRLMTFRVFNPVDDSRLVFPNLGR
jgi:HAMP domain-containing protein